jgi:hypothetical protein
MKPDELEEVRNTICFEGTDEEVNLFLLVEELKAPILNVELKWSKAILLNLKG